MIELAAIGVRSEVGRIGFDEQTITRNGTCRLSYACGIGERNRARKRNIPTTFGQFARHFGGAAVAVKHALDVGEVQDGFKAIAVCFAVVDDDGQAETFGKLHLLVKKEGLQIFVHWNSAVVVGLPMVVKADFTKGDNFVFFSFFFVFKQGRKL